MSSLNSSSVTNPLVTALLTDLYQITMTYAHWKNGKHNDPSVFELFFRKNPFKGEFTIFCGLDECLKHIRGFGFSDSDIEYLKSTPALEQCEDEFFEYLASLKTTKTTTSATAEDDFRFEVSALQEGTIVFPRIPMIIIESPLGLGQLLETTLLNLVNYPSLIATNAARMVIRAAPAPCIEFGLRRAQGPDGACSASKYSYVGGFVATSNVQAGKMFGIPISGTHAHSYVQSFTSLDEVESLTLFHKESQQSRPFLPEVLKYREKAMSKAHSQTTTTSKTITTTNDGELAAFCAYACAFPNNCLCLIDTYDTLHSGLQNFIFVASALYDFGYIPKGVRLDSGDLATLSLACKAKFAEMATRSGSSSNQGGGGKDADFWNHLTIVASNDINEDILHSFAASSSSSSSSSSLGSPTSHGITAFGIGTNLVTCQKQPALGCVYKLVEWKGQPRIKLSQDFGKMTIPGKKMVYRLFGQDGHPLVDYMTLSPTSSSSSTAATELKKDEDPVPLPGQRIICRDPFRVDKRLAIVPTKVVPLHSVVFSRQQDASSSSTLTELSLSQTREYVQEQLKTLPPGMTDYKATRSYDVMVSETLFSFLRNIWEKEAPIEQRH